MTRPLDNVSSLPLLDLKLARMGKRQQLCAPVATSFWLLATSKQKLLALARSTDRLNFLHESSQHPLHFQHLLLCLAEVAFRQQSEILCQEQMVFSLAGGAPGNLQETTQFSI